MNVRKKATASLLEYLSQWCTGSLGLGADGKMSTIMSLITLKLYFSWETSDQIKVWTLVTWPEASKQSILIGWCRMKHATCRVTYNGTEHAKIQHQCTTI